MPPTLFGIAIRLYSGKTTPIIKELILESYINIERSVLGYGQPTPIPLIIFSMNSTRPLNMESLSFPSLKRICNHPNY